MLEDQDWYSSHAESMTMDEFISIEVEERDNYNQGDIDLWWEKYDIGLDDSVIWVTDLENCVDLYCDLADPVKIDVRLIIEESNDGDGGYLAVL